MRAAIDWSYDLLDPAQRRLFGVLGSLAGEFTLEAVAAAAGLEPDDPEVSDGLDALVDNSLVRRLPWADGTRFRMLEPMREYAQERLVESGEEDAVRRLLLVHMMPQLEAVESEFDGPQAPRLLTPGGGRLPDPAGDAGVGAGHRAGRTWRRGWPWRWARTGSRPGAWSRAVSGWAASSRPAAPPRGCTSPPARSPTSRTRAPAAQGHLETALELARGDGRRRDTERGCGLAYLGAVVLGSGRHRPRGRDGTGGAGAVAGGGAPTSRRPWRCRCRQSIAATQGDLKRERSRYEERLELVRGKDDRRRIAETLNNLAELALATEAVDLARAYAREALELARNVTKTVTPGRVDLAGADRAGRRGRQCGNGFHCRSAALSLELGQQFEIAQSLLVFAGIAGVQGDAVLAARLYGCAARLRGETSPLDVELEPDIARQRGEVRQSLGADAFLAAQAHGSAMSIEDAVSPRDDGRCRSPLAADPVATVLQAADHEHHVAGAERRRLGGAHGPRDAGRLGRGRVAETPQFGSRQRTPGWSSPGDRPERSARPARRFRRRRPGSRRAAAGTAAAPG